MKLYRRILVPLDGSVGGAADRPATVDEACGAK